MLELHCHTTCSDGSLSPSQLVEAAARAGVKALAISDHDTLAGWDEAVEAGSRWGVEIIPAVELSTVWQGRSLHLLGFYPRREQLTPPLEERRQGRIRRAEAMVQRLAELGYPIPMPSTHLTPGRPHLAQALVRAGHVRNAREAFERFLGDDGPAFVPYEKFSALEGIQLLRACGAVPVWAHPGLFRGDTLENTFAALLGARLMGLEVYHPDHNVRQKRQLLKLAQKHNLVVTGGSDYHGPNQAGFRLNMMNLSLDLLDALKAAHARLSA
ncbi:MAG: PHP domain-containing protein [Thermostichus sp. DG02_5_bins_236]